MGIRGYFFFQLWAPLSTGFIFPIKSSTTPKDSSFCQLSKYPHGVTVSLIFPCHKGILVRARFGNMGIRGFHFLQLWAHLGTGSIFPIKSSTTPKDSSFCQPSKYPHGVTVSLISPCHKGILVREIRKSGYSWIPLFSNLGPS